MNILTTREWATLIWGIILLVLALLHREIKKSLCNVVKIFFGPKLRILWEIILLYVIIITVVFSYLPFWNVIFIKDVVIWFMFSGIIFCMNAVSEEADEKYIIKILKENLKLTIIIQFLISTFTFNFWIELIIIPIISILVLLNAIAESMKEYEVVHKFFNCILGIAWVWILIKSIETGIREYKELNLINTFVSFMIPIVYLLLIIPLEYILELYSKYELLFVRMSFKEKKDEKIHRRHCFHVIKACKFSVYSVLLFQKEYWKKMYIGMSEDEFDQLMNDFSDKRKKR